MKRQLFAAPLQRLAFRLGVALLAICTFGSVQAAPLRIETIDVAPLGFCGADGKATGIWYEVANLIAQEAGLPYENVLTPYARTVKDLEDGTASFVVRASNEQLQKSSIQVALVATLPSIVVGGSGTHFNELADMHGKTIGILRGGKYNEKFSGDELIKKFELNDYAQGLNMLLAKRLDGTVATSIGFYYELQKRGLTKSQLGEPFLLGTQDIFLLFSKKNADDKTIAALKAAVEKLQKQGAIDKVVRKYIGDFKWSASDFRK